MAKVYFAKGGGGGGHASSSHASASRSSSSSSKSTSSSKSSSSSRSKAATTSGKSTAKPGSTVKTASGKTVKSSTAKPTNIKNARSTGVVGDNGYTPRFNGYSAPTGSVVYYPSYGFSDYLFWSYLFSQNSPHNAQATVVQPDGKQVVAQPQKGVDGMQIFNWIVMILFLLAIIGGIVWCVNKKTKK